LVEVLLLCFHDIRDKLLKKKVEETHKILEEHKKDWKKFGCTIMTDE
jgi:D-serine deaminase-like pyridoxal phosphate-dependent protein